MIENEEKILKFLNEETKKFLLLILSNNEIKKKYIPDIIQSSTLEITRFNLKFMKDNFEISKFEMTKNFIEYTNVLIGNLAKKDLINPCYIALLPLNEKEGEDRIG